MPLRVVPRRDRKLNRLVKASEIRSLRRGEALFLPGEAARNVFLVREGYLRLIEPPSAGARERTVAVAGPWELLGEEGMGQGSRRYRCTAGEPARVQELDGRAVFRVLKSTERTFAALMDGMTVDLARVRYLVTGSGGPSARSRVALVLLELTRRWGEARGTAVLLPHRLTHQVLADLAGAHRSTVTTTLNDWLYDGLLAETEEGLIMARPKRLERLANGGAVKAARR